jgi:hypothetical protein
MKNKFFLYILLIGLATVNANDPETPNTGKNEKEKTLPCQASAVLAGKKVLALQQELDSNTKSTEEAKKALQEKIAENKAIFASVFPNKEINTANLDELSNALTLLEKAKYYILYNKWITAGAVVGTLALGYGAYIYFTSEADNSEEEEE